MLIQRMVHISLVLRQVIYAIVAALELCVRIPNSQISFCLCLPQLCTGVQHTEFHSLSVALSIETDDLRQWRLGLTEKLCKQKLLKG